MNIIPSEILHINYQVGSVEKSAIIKINQSIYSDFVSTTQFCQNILTQIKNQNIIAHYCVLTVKKNKGVITASCVLKGKIRKFTYNSNLESLVQIKTIKSNSIEQPGFMSFILEMIANLLAYFAFVSCVEENKASDEPMLTRAEPTIQPQPFDNLAFYHSTLDFASKLSRAFKKLHNINTEFSKNEEIYRKLNAKYEKLKAVYAAQFSDIQMVDIWPELDESMRRYQEEFKLNKSTFGKEQITINGILAKRGAPARIAGRWRFPWYSLPEIQPQAGIKAEAGVQAQSVPKSKPPELLFYTYSQSSSF